MADAIKKANGRLFPEDKLCKWLVQLLMALDYLHVNHILHRDVKCSNVFLTKDQNIRLGDFGLAKMLTSDELASSVVGTPSYMCPELLADIPYGSKSDIWSLGCCIYEMTALRPAFKAFDMQGLINKITKSIVAPLPSSYSGAFRGLIKSMLRKSPEHRPSAAELLRHPHLQPYVVQVNLKSSPTYNSLPVPHPVSDHIKKIRFPDRDDDSVCKDRDKRYSFPLERERILKQNQPSNGHDSVSSTRSIKTYPDYPNRGMKESSVGSSQIRQSITRTGYTPSKAFTTPKKHVVLPAKGTHTGTNRRSSQSSKTPMDRLARPNRRSSLPFETPKNHRSTANIIQQLDSPDVSVNAPRIDRIAEFPLASSEDPLFSVRTKLSSTRTSPIDRSITKDKCTVQIFRTEGDNGSDSSGRNPMVGDASSRGSNDSRHRRFDTSSHQQRAEALEGLLEFSAKLLQQERFEELGVLLKPFGLEKVSPRETAIWLTKSFKESTT